MSIERTMTEPIAHGPHRPGPQRVLIVDDSPDIPPLVKALLPAHEIDMHFAADGIGGLEAALQLLPDLILLDVDMPVMDGFEVCRQIKANPRLSHIPLIFLTGMSSPEERLRGLELGAIDYITKPFDKAELRARVRSALRTKQLMDMLAAEASRLQQSEERFRLLAEDSSDLISRHSPQGTYLYASPIAESMLGYSAKELIGHSIIDLVHSEDRQRLVEFADGTPLLRGAQAATVRIRCRDGAHKWFEAAIHAVHGGEQFQISCRDVTRRKQDEDLEKDRIRVLELVAAGRPLDDVLIYLTSMIERYCPSGTACILALSDGDLQVVGPSLPEEFRSALRCKSLRLAADVCSEASTLDQPMLISNIASDPPWRSLRDVAARHGYERCFSRLIQSPTYGVIGMVNAYLRDHETDSRGLARFFDVAASLISVAAEHRQLSARLAYQASHDALTGLPNRVLFSARLQQAIQDRHAGQVGLMLFDLDRFKLINDTLGHAAGDELLQQLAARVQDSIRQTDTLARLGGDEFGIILAPPVDRDTAVRIARRIQQTTERKFRLVSHDVSAMLSIGIALLPGDASTAPMLQSHADVALYHAKAMGRNNFQCYDSQMDASSMRRIDMESHLRGALERGELSLHYQPQIDRQGTLTGLEALLRWNNPDLGDVSPTAFIPVAEESGLIVPIGTWVLREVCRQGRAWRDAGLEPVVIAANVSALQFAQPDFHDSLMLALGETGFDPRFLELEVTESSVMRDIHETAVKIRRLAAAGVRVSIDDFGAGYSSLAYLDRLSLHRLKIDRAFIHALDAQAIANPERTAIVRAIISLGHNLGLNVVAEGVETMQQFQFLDALGCDAMQGYLVSPPRSAQDIGQFLSTPAAMNFPACGQSAKRSAQLPATGLARAC